MPSAKVGLAEATVESSPAPARQSNRGRSNGTVTPNMRSTTGGGSFFDMAENAKTIATRRMKMVGSRTHVGSAQKQWWIIDPRINKSVNYWDGATLLALVFTALCVSGVQMAVARCDGAHH